MVARKFGISDANTARSKRETVVKGKVSVSAVKFPLKGSTISGL